MTKVRLSFPPNEPVPLGNEVCVSVAGDNGEIRPNWAGRRIPCRPRFRLAPAPGLELVSREETESLWPDEPPDGLLTFKWGGCNRGRFGWSNHRTIADQEARVVETVWQPARQPLLVHSGRETSATEIHCGVVNFPRFSGRGDELRRGDDGGSTRHGRVRAQAGPWLIELKECGNARDLFGELAASQGFAVTHEARIVRSDAESIVPEEASLLLRALDDFLSFARGSCCSLALVTAVDESEEVVWEQWGCRRVDPWRRWSSSWLDLQHGHTLGEAFPGFWAVYSGCRERRAALSEALYWYVRSETHQSGVDGGLILLQAGLERLAHTFFRPKTGRNELTASWLRDALTERQIPVGIPTGSDALGAYAGGVAGKDGARDGVFAVTKLRNNSVHPAKDADVPDGAYYETWELARWLVEVMVLNVTGYEGEYANRLSRRFIGQVERVPWARSD